MTEDELFHKLLLRAGAYTARAEHSPQEVEKKLYVWGGEDVSPRIVKRVLGDLESGGYIDAGRYAEKYTRDKALFLHKGPKLIRRELYSKGITDKGMIEEALSTIEENEWEEALRAYLSPKLRQYRAKAKNAGDLSSRLYRAAYARGYEDRQIRAYLRGANLSEEDFEDPDDWD